MIQKLHPLHDRLLIKSIEADTTTASGLIIPDKALKKSDEGEVVAAGTGVTLEDGSVLPMLVKVGDHVLFARGSETEVVVDGETLLILREEDILGIIERSSR